jgi:hypothetical protein
MYALYSKLYFGMGSEGAAPVAIGDILPVLRKISVEALAK